MVLRIGQKVPDFSLPDTENKSRSLSEFIRDGPVVLVFFPFAFSGVCDKEMCTLRDTLSDLHAINAHLGVVGVSVDSTYTLKAFMQTYNLPFPLLSDFNRRAMKLYGVIQDSWVVHGYKGVAKRSVFLVDLRGFLRYRWITDIPSQEPPYPEIIKAAQKLAI